MSNHHADQAAFSEQFLAGQRYWQTSHGRRQWQAEKQCLHPLLARSGVQHALEIGVAPPLLAHDSIRHRISWAPQRDLAEHPSTLVCRPEALPLADEALELVLVHHMLEVAPQPGHLLREAARVTSDSGRLILIGWHPLGIAGPARLKRCHERFYQRSRWLTPGRLRDWLAFIDFNIERIDYCGFVPFENTPDWLLMETWGRRHNLPLGRAWVISAKRQMCRMIPLKKRFDPGAMLGSKVSSMACMSHESGHEPSHDIVQLMSSQKAHDTPNHNSSSDIARERKQRSPTAPPGVMA